MRRAGRFGLVVAAALALAAQAVAAPRDYAMVSVDAAHTTGTLKPLRGVSGAPDWSFAKTIAGNQWGPPRPVDVSAGYRKAQVNLVRTHDSLGAGDIDPSAGSLPPLQGPTMGGNSSDNDYLIFPDPAADPADPKSYRFGPTDTLIKGIRAINADVLFRLGRGAGTTAEPPKDLARYGEIIRHIVLHYNKGWDNGFTDSVRYWEVWNEPDLGKIWWRGTPDDYYRLYGAASKAVKAADPKAQVGGPTIALVNQVQPYREGFLAYARDHRLPLDFFSWHYYSDANDPQDFPRIGHEMRGLLDRYGFRKTASFLDEWNANEMTGIAAHDVREAAFVASSVIYMQDAPIDRELLYRADGAFGPDGKTPSKLGQALVALGRMSGTPVRLATHGGDLSGLAIEAGSSRDGRTVQVLISNYEIPEADRGPRPGSDVMHVPGLFDLLLPPRRSVSYANNHGYDLTIKGLAGKGGYVIERYRLSATNDFERVDTRKATGPVIHIDGALPAPAVELVVVRR